MDWIGLDLWLGSIRLNLRLQNRVRLEFIISITLPTKVMVGSRVKGRSDLPCDVHLAPVEEHLEQFAKPTRIVISGHHTVAVCLFKCQRGELLDDDEAQARAWQIR